MLPQGLDLDLASWRNQSIKLEHDENLDSVLQIAQ